MAFWNTDNPKKPWGIMDPDAVLDYPISFADWLTGIGAGYASHVVTCEAPLNLVDSSHSNGIITVRLNTTGYVAATHAGNKYSFTVTVVADDTPNAQQDDRSFWLKLEER